MKKSFITCVFFVLMTTACGRAVPEGMVRVRLGGSLPLFKTVSRHLPLSPYAQFRSNRQETEIDELYVEVSGSGISPTISEAIQGSVDISGIGGVGDLTQLDTGEVELLVPKGSGRIFKIIGSMYEVATGYDFPIYGESGAVTLTAPTVVLIDTYLGYYFRVFEGANLPSLTNTKFTYITTTLSGIACSGVPLEVDAILTDLDLGFAIGSDDGTYVDSTAPVYVHTFGPVIPGHFYELEITLRGGGTSQSMTYEFTMGSGSYSLSLTSTDFSGC